MQTLVIGLSAQRKSKRAVCLTHQYMHAGFSSASAWVWQTHLARRAGRLSRCSPSDVRHGLQPNQRPQQALCKLSTLRDILDSGIFDNCLCLAVPKVIFTSNFSCNCKINMNKKDVKHWWRIHFSQQVVGKAKIKNLSRVTPDLVISSTGNKHMWENGTMIYTLGLASERPPGSTIAGYNPTGAWMSFSLECCVSSSRSLCDWPIIRTEVSYQLWGTLSVISKR